jgi:hypothetical protein
MRSSTTRGNASTTSSNKRKASELDDDEDSILRSAPSGPWALIRGAYNRISSAAQYRSQLSNNTSYIFISAGNIGIQNQYIDDMYKMLDKENERFSVGIIRGDPEGYFWIFDSPQGDHHAVLCYQHFQGRIFGNTRMQLELHLRIIGGA